MNGSGPVAYSQLPKVLAKHRLKISDLHQKLKDAGVSVNYKSLYRLIAAHPLQKIDTRIVGAICQACGVGIQDLIGFEKPKPILAHLSNDEQKRLDDLMTRHSEETLSAEELHDFDELAEKAHQLTLTNARLLLSQRRALNARPGKTRRPQSRTTANKPGSHGR
jgi:hypothetical protein